MGIQIKIVERLLICFHILCTNGDAMIKSFIININTFFIMLKQMKEILNKKQKAQCLILLVGVFVCAMLETLGVSAIIPFVVVMFSREGLMQNQYVKLISDILDISTYQELLIATALIIIIVYLVKNVSLLIFQYYQGKVHNVIEKELMTKQYRMFMLRPYSFYLNINTAEVMRGLSGDIVQVAQTMDAFIGLASELITVLMIGAFIVVMDPIMAFSLILIAGFIALIFVLGFKRKTSELGSKCREIFYKRSKIVLETVGGYKEISIRQKKEHFIEEYGKVNDDACRMNTLYMLIMKIPSRAVETVFISSLLIVACVRIGFYDDNSQFVSLIGAMGVAAIRILPSISSISNHINSLIYNRPSLEAAYNNITQVRQEEGKYSSLLKNQNTSHEVKFENDISLKNVYYRYDNTDKDILKDVSLKIRKNESVGFIGESGAGKSTLLDVLLGLLKPQQGGVYMDDVDIDDIPFAWAEAVGYVPQNVFLIDDSIRNNIAFGLKADEIEDERVWDCLKQAKLDEFVKRLPNGLDTEVGERGVRFSGGQRQRVAIARALYHDPQILVLDEATSALDNETEKEVMEAIDGFRGKLTIIIVAHRLSTIEKCNKVYVVGNGNVELRQ